MTAQPDRTEAVAQGGRIPTARGLLRGGAELRLGLGLVGVGLLGMAMLNATPFLTGALIDQRGLTSIEAGGVNSVELLCSALVALALSRLWLPAPPRGLGLLACGLFALGNLMSVGHGTVELFVARGVAGVGEGLAFAAIARAVARAASPALVAAALALVLAVVGAGQALLTGFVVSRHGYVGGYLYLAVVGLVGGLLAGFLPSSRLVLDPAKSSSPSGAYGWRAAAPVLVAACMILIGSGSVWSFSERIGQAAGLSATQVASAISLTALAGVGGGAAAVAAARLKRDFLMAGLGAVIFGISVSIFAVASTPSVYVVALSVLSFAYLFITPFITAIAVRVDPSGGLASAAQGAQMLAGAIGPVVGGALLATGSFATLALLTAGTSALAVWAIVDAQRQSRAQPAPSVSFALPTD